MSSLKVLKSIGHNTAHSYLSLMNYIDGNYIVEYIYQIAKKTSNTYVKIDILNMRIEPEVYRTSQIQTSLLYLKKTFIRLCNSEHIEIDRVMKATIIIEFDLLKTVVVESINLEKASYNCTSIIEDISGKQHIANVVEWWK